MVKTYTAALYIRISVDDDIGNDESFSVTNQRMYLTGYIHKSSDIQIDSVLEYVDDGYTGTNFQRPQFQKMIEDVKNGLIDCIIVKDFSRFAREYIDITDFLTNFFPLMNVRFISINDNFDSQYNDPTALDVSFRNLIYDFYSKDISEKVRSGVYSKMRQGHFIGAKPPYGYRIDNSGEIRKLIIDEESAPVIRRIFDLVLSGYTAIEVAKMLNDEHVLTASEYKVKQGYKIPKCHYNGYWNNHLVRSIINNEQYTGKVISAKKTVRKIGSSALVAIPKKDRIITENAHEAIISERDFIEANKRIALNYRKHHDDKSRKRIFLKKIKCACCGYTMARLSTGKGRYICRTEKVKFFEGCVREYVYEDTIEKVVLEELNHYIAIISERHNKRLLIMEKAKRDKADAGRKLNTYKRVLQKYERAKLKAYEDYLDEKTSRLDYEQRKIELDINISDTKATLENLEQLALYDESKERPVHPIVQLYLDRKPLTQLDEQIVDDLIEKILLHSSDKMEIFWKFKDVF